MSFLNEVFPEIAAKLTKDEIDAIHSHVESDKKVWGLQVNQLMQSVTDLHQKLEISKECIKCEQYLDEMGSKMCELSEIRLHNKEAVGTIHQLQEEYNAAKSELEQSKTVCVNMESSFNKRLQKKNHKIEQLKNRLSELLEDVSSLKSDKEKHLELAKSLFTSLGGELTGTGGFNCLQCNRLFSKSK